MKKAVALITRKPHTNWLDFLNEFTKYDVFVIIDDNSENYLLNYVYKYPKIKFIQINDRECCDNGFVGSSTATNLPAIISWDKALYFFSHCETSYSNIWFFEDDVFFLSEETLINMDKAYPFCELLTRSHTIKNENNFDGWWHWFQISGKISLPWAYSLICMCRVSYSLLQKVRKYANENKHIFFVESILNTLALHNGMNVGCPPELYPIVQGDISPNEIKKENMWYVFHPYKNIDIHPDMRIKLLLT